jgi:hypothetical protein
MCSGIAAEKENAREAQNIASPAAATATTDYLAAI